MVESHLSADATRQLAADELVQVLKDCVREVFVSMLFSFDDADAAELAGDAVPAALPANAIGEETSPELAANPDCSEGSTSEFDCGIEVEFTGAVSGAVVLRAGRGAAEEITRSRLMMEPDEVLEDEDVQDALGECVNLVAGTLKTRALDPLGTFQLGVPGPLDPANVGPTLGDGPSATGRSQVYRLSKCSFAMEIWTDAGSAEGA